MKYKEQKNIKTGETRWVPIEGTENVVDKINNIPIVGNVTQPITKVISGAVTGATIDRNLGTVLESSQNQQKISLELTKLAQAETDPARKKMLLDRARQISQGATSQLEGFTQPLMENMPQDYQNKETPIGAGNLKAYGADALKAGLAVGEAYSLPSQVKGAINLTKGAVGLTKKGVSKVAGKVSDISQAEKVRKFVQKVNPQIKPTDPNYNSKKKAILEFSKKFFKTGKESAEQVVESASNKRDFNLKSIKTLLGNSKKVVEESKLTKKILGGLREVEVDPKAPQVKVAIKNIERMIGNVVEDGKINPTKLYKVYGEMGEKAYSGVKDVRPVYDKVYKLIGEEIKRLSPRARTLIAENAKIRELLPGVIKSSEKLARKGLLGGFGKNVAKVGAGVATGLAISKVNDLFRKK